MSNTATNGNAAKVMEACGQFLGRIRVHEMAQATGLTNSQVSVAFTVLVARDLVYRPLRGVFRLTPKGFAALVEPVDFKSGPKGPRVMELPYTSVRTRVWRALRLTRKGSVNDFLILASQGEEIDPVDTRLYLRALAKAGYLTRMSTKGEKGTTRYLLMRDTGPKAPQWNKRQRRILDANTGEIHDLA